MAKKKIPKKIAGFKIPKVLRKNSLLKSLVGTAGGRQLVAEALVAAAGAAAAALVASQSTEGHGKGGKSALVNGSEDGLEAVQRALKEGVAALTDVLGKAAQSAIGVAKDHKPDKAARSATTH
jgi:hypothetical protein